MNELAPLIISSEYFIPLIFLGILIVGIPVLLPAIFIAVHGGVSLPLVVIVSITATLISDSLWYFIGKKAGKNFQKFPFFDRRIERAEKAFELFDVHAFKIIFFSRFLYGTRTAACLLSGSRSLSFIRFLNLSFLSMTAWLAGTIFLALAVSSVASLQDAIDSVKLSFTVFIILIISTYAVSGFVLRKKYPSKKSIL